MTTHDVSRHHSSIVKYFNDFLTDRMMTSSNGNIFLITGSLWGESNGHRWIPLTKAIDVELWYFLSSAAEQMAEQTIETPGIWDAIALNMTWL